MNKPSDKTKELCEQEMLDVFEVIIDFYKQGPKGKYDPYDEYIEALRAKFYQNSALAKSNLIKGYETLLNTLKN